MNLQAGHVLLGWDSEQSLWVSNVNIKGKRGGRIPGRGHYGPKHGGMRTQGGHMGR